MRTGRSTSRRSRRSSISTYDRDDGRRAERDGRPNRGKLRVGTRGSALALRQAELAISAFTSVSSVDCEIVTFTTKGDRDKTTPLAELGTKAIFAHELQRALIDGEIDVAVHSLKDLTGAEPDGLELAAVLQREDPRDVLVSPTGADLEALPAGATVGTSSVRREALIRIVRPDLVCTPLRGNVDTRLRKVADGEVDAAVLAAAGIIRLGRGDEITAYLDPHLFVPPPGQGAIAIEARSDRIAGDLAWLVSVDHADTHRCVATERVVMEAIEGSCEVPLGVWATVDAGTIYCEAIVASKDGTTYIRDSLDGTDPQVIGIELASRLLQAGAADLVADG